jgi:hypothetical protein
LRQQLRAQRQESVPIYDWGTARAAE